MKAKPKLVLNWKYIYLFWASWTVPCNYDAASPPPCPNLQILSCISVFCNLVSRVNLRGLFSYPPTHVFGLREDNPQTLPPTVFFFFFSFPQQNSKDTKRVCARQQTLPVLSHRPNVCLHVKQCVIPRPSLTRRSREDKLCEWGARTSSPLLPSPSLSFFPNSPPTH